MRGNENWKSHPKLRARRARFDKDCLPRRDQDDDEEVDWEDSDDISSEEKVLEALKYLVSKSGSTKGKKVAYLNALVKILGKTDSELGLRIQEIMLCLRIPLVDESCAVRAAALRVFRYTLSLPQAVFYIYELNIHRLVVRSLDIALNNQVERIQAVRLIRKLLFSSPSSFPVPLVRCLIAIVEGGTKEGDKLTFVSLSILCELSVLNEDLFLRCNGIKALFYSVLDVAMPRMAEAVLSCLLRLMNHPEQRAKFDINLGAALSPLTEFAYVHNWFQSSENLEESMSKSQQAFLSLVRSWTGLLFVCNVKKREAPLHAIVELLHISNERMNNIVIDLLFDLLYIKTPKWSDDFDEILANVDTSSFRDNWQLKEDFVAAEGRDIIPHLSKSRPNLKENHVVVLLSCLLKLDLSSGLVKVILNVSNESLRLKALVLLGEFLYKVFKLLPEEITTLNQCLPTLFSKISSIDLDSSNKASRAISFLHRFHCVKKLKPSACSLFFREILAKSERYKSRESLRTPLVYSSKLDDLNVSLKESGVLRSEYPNWRWERVSSVLRSYNQIKSLDSQNSKTFIKKLLMYFKLSNGRFSKLPLGQKSKDHANIGILFIEFCLRGKASSPELSEIMDDFLSDIHYNLKEVLKSESSTDYCLLSPSKIATTASQYYFLFIGYLSASETGRIFLGDHGFLKSFALLLSLRCDFYMKLVLASLDYSTDWGSRSILERALTDSLSENTRLYATEFLGVLIRCKTPNVAQWGISFLINQLQDSSLIVTSSAQRILDEACDDKMNLEAVICTFASFPRIKLESYMIEFRRRLLFIRFTASHNGLKFLRQISFLEPELELWGKKYNLQYVVLVEELLNDSFTYHSRDLDGTFTGKFGAKSVSDLYLPPHLYGQLASSSEGLELLFRSGSPFWSLFQTLRLAKVTENQLLVFKAAIWGVCHAASSAEGARVVDQHGAIRRVLDIAMNSKIYCLRGTAYYALSLVAMNRIGVEALIANGWVALKHSRNEAWPVVEDLFKLQQIREMADELSGGTSLEEEEEDDHQKTLTPNNIDSLFSISPGSRSSKNPSRLGSIFRSLSLTDSSENKVFRRLSESRASLSKKIRKSLSRSSSTRRGSDESSESVQKRLSFSSCGDEEPVNLSINSSPSPVKEDSVNAGLENIVEEPSPGPKTIDSGSTSGVSSDDSYRIASGHTSVQPKLSPIASSASLSTVVMTRGQQRAYSEGEPVGPSFYPVPKATAESVTSISSSGSSWTENAGYHTLRSLHIRRRPFLSESENDNNRRGQETETKDSNSTYLDRRDSWNWKTKSLDHRIYKKIRLKSLPTPKIEVLPIVEPQYWGICVPLDISALFPEEDDEKCNENTINQFVIPTTYNGVEVHIPGQCLGCYRLTMPMTSERSRTSSINNPDNISDKEIPCGESPENLRKFLITKNTFGEHSGLGASSSSVISETESEETVKDTAEILSKVLQRKEVMRLIESMHPLGTKIAEQGLLRMKQKFPTIFTDLCLYSEVVKLLCDVPFRLGARRFIQELFLSLEFEEFFQEPTQILGLTENLNKDFS